METTLTVIGALVSLAGGILGYPLVEMMDDFQRWSVENDQSTILKAIEKYETKLESATRGKTFSGNDYLTGSLFGLFFAQKINAAAYSRLHQAYRYSHGLPEYSLEEYPGIIDRTRTLTSFDEIRRAIRRRREDFEPRNTRPLSLILVVAGSLVAIGGTLAK